MTIDEAIHLESYDEQWAEWFIDEQQGLVSEIKRRIVSQGARGLLQYSDEKNAFVEQLLVRAERWMNGRTS
ncbi:MULTISPECIES: hypothetical protein [Paenibacillus]|uniref:hypothetical protein n=1 Tax=Paenibacillus TaxID=44249 RepID=UPI001165A984|nr:MULTISPECIES: hypothetical protein [unclassified Paenibacillus]AWP29379.1 hypothetical protein B9D94_23405 [Paenibacillus sp. Cedars]MDH6672613.1 GrpB-like predicted nucleotidyltransferase (UPF0157 family) [Paenibacillus sp. LBL]